MFNYVFSVLIETLKITGGGGVGYSLFGMLILLVVYRGRKFVLRKKLGYLKKFFYVEK